MRKVNLKFPQDVRRLLSRVVNLLLAEEIDTSRANAIGQICNVMLRAMEKGELEKRIEDLEKLAFNQNQNSIRSEHVKNS